MTLLDLYNIPNTVWLTGDRQVFRSLDIKQIELTIYVSPFGQTVKLDPKEDMLIRPDGTFTVYEHGTAYTLRLMRIIPFTAEHTLMLSLGIKEEDLCEP